MQPDKDFHGPRITKSLLSVLLNVINEVLAALVKLHPPQMPYDRINGANTNSEDTASAFNAIMISLTSILSSIHINSITILQHHTRQANIPMAYSNGLPSTSNSPTSPLQYIPTGKDTTLYSVGASRS